MGRVFLIQFDQNPSHEFYLCRKCQTQIAPREERRFNNTKDNELKGPVFGNAINWHTLGEEPNRRVGDYVVAKIYCNNCSNHLGFQFIEILNDDILVKEKYLLLNLSNLLLWETSLILLNMKFDGYN